MDLIVGHTTHDSVWIWVRGDRKDRRLEVELKRLSCRGCGETEFVDESAQLEAKTRHTMLKMLACSGCGRSESVKKVAVEVEAKRDYTAVARFDQVLSPNTTYRVLVRSKKRSGELQGRLRTFAAPGDARPFEFVYGSCNLSTARLTALGGLAASWLGGLVTRNSLKRPVTDWHRHAPSWYLRLAVLPGVRRLVRRLLLCLGWLNVGATYLMTYLTRFEQPKPPTNEELLPSPFAKLADEIVGFDEEDAANEIDEEDAVTRPAFMIHAGDQIYFDIDFPARGAEKEHYRRNYRQAWFEDDSTAQVLRRLPNYMILDDHEVLDNFGTDPDDTQRNHLEPALDAYDEYVSARQPQRRPGPGQSRHWYHKGYTFEHGDTGFFVLDTRTKRSVERGHMIDPAQLAHLDKWLRGEEPYRAYKLRFVVSSVPFVAQLRPAGFDADGERRQDKRADTWSGHDWQGQRERIISLIYQVGVERLVFLVGDRHCAYHATMQIGPPSRRLVVHELAGGPINQLHFARRDDFYAQYRGTCRKHPCPEENGTDQPLPWTSRLEAFHEAAPALLRISVTPQSESAPPEVGWRVERTRTPVEPLARRQIVSILKDLEHGRPRRDVCREHGISAQTLYRWRLDKERQHRGQHEPERASEDVETLASPAPHPLCGRIRFHRRRDETA